MQTEDEKLEFSCRLNELMVIREIDVRHRIGKLAAWTQVSREGARKWLRGMAIPEKSKIRVICVQLKCREEWLEYGVEPISAIQDGSHDEVDAFLEAIREQLLKAEGARRRDLMKALLLLSQ